MREQSSQPFVWVDMQVYARRDDHGVVSDVIRDILDQTAELLKDQDEFRRLLLLMKDPDIEVDGIRRHLPAIRRLLSHIAASGQELFVFLDDFHVLAKSLQPELLDVLYAVCRGNRVFLKLSAIETLARTFDPRTRHGLEVPRRPGNPTGLQSHDSRQGYAAHRGNS